MESDGVSYPWSPPRVEGLRVKNYRALRNLSLTDLTPLTILLGPNGSGKSTCFDVLSFLAECFQQGLRSAWDRRGKGKELISRGAEGPLLIELKYRERSRQPLLTYHLEIEESARGPVVAEEWLQWRRSARGRPFKFLNFKRGEGEAVSGEEPDELGVRQPTKLTGEDLIAVNSLGQFSDHPRVAALRAFIVDWYISYLSVADARQIPQAGPQPRLSRTGDNLANVIQYLSEQHPDRLQEIFSILRDRVPRLQEVNTATMADGRLMLQLKDIPFDRPVLSRFTSDGTLKLLAYLTVLYNPDPPKFVGIEEPENFLYPRLLPDLAEECRAAAERSQLIVTTHSPYFLDAVRPEEVRMLSRSDAGYTQAIALSDIPRVKAFLNQGASLGELWLEDQFSVNLGGCSELEVRK